LSFCFPFVFFPSTSTTDRELTMTNICPQQTHSRNVMHRWLVMMLFTIGSVAMVAAGDAPPVRPQAASYLNVPSAPPKPTGGFTVAAAYPKLFFQGAIAVRPVPGTNRLWVLEREGRIWSFEDDLAATTKTLVLDLNDDDNDPEDATPNAGHVTAGTRWWCQGWDDCGLMGLAFHPEFGQVNSPNRGYFYIGYQAKSIPPDVGASPSYRPSSSGAARNTSNRLARFTVPDSSVSADPSSEQILLDQSDPHLWHNGGDVFFDNQGFLYAVNGDGGDTYDVYQNSQRISKGLFSGVLRIDVDWTPSSTRSHAPPARQPGQPPLYAGYGIPNDNPFVEVAGALQEFYAIGLRSPHRMTYDPATEQILIGDIGQGQREEVTSVTRGSNHQWGYLEGFANKSVDGSIKESRIPPTYVTATSLAAGALNAPLAYTAPSADPSLPPGMLVVGDYVRFGSQVRRIAALSAYPHTSVTFDSPLTQSVLSSIALTRTTGFVVSGTITSTVVNDNVPSGLGTTTIPISGSGLLTAGTCVSFGVANAFGSYQIIAASDNGTTTTSITVRPRLPASATLTLSTWVDRLTVIGNEQPPIADFKHGGDFAFNAIIGGYVYRGPAHPELNGSYIFADNVRGTVYQMSNIGSLSPTIQRLFTFPGYNGGYSGYGGLSGFGTDHHNELLICRLQSNSGFTNQSTGQIWKLIRSSGSVDNPTVIGDPIPTDLANTGAFLTNGSGNLILPLQPSPALIPYGVNSPLWSDNAKKTRWISVPNSSGKTTGFDPISEQITFRSTGAFTFPAGTVFY
jgi:glucose/arabinose dehydrogenase